MIFLKLQHYLKLSVENINLNWKYVWSEVSYFVLYLNVSDRRTRRPIAWTRPWSRKTHLNYKGFLKLIFTFALSLTRGKSLRTTKKLSVFFSFCWLKNKVISALLPCLLPITTASVSYAGGSGFNIMSRIHGVQFAGHDIFQVNNL